MPTTSDILTMVYNIENRRGNWLNDLDTLKFLAIEQVA